jgi:putative transcriptional regulator
MFPIASGIPHIIGKKHRPIAFAIALILIAVFFSSSFTGEATSRELMPFRPARIPERPPSPHSFHPEKELDKGKFLVASPNLGDPRFAEAVILLIHYDNQGAMGVVINRPTKLRLSDAFPDTEEFKQRTDTIYFGGPVAITQILILIRSPIQKEESFPVLKDVYMSSSLKVFHEMVDSDRKGINFRMYAGYAGWAPGQLEAEVLRGDWYILPADSDTIFEKPSSQIWPNLINRGSGMRVEEIIHQKVSKGITQE